MSAILSTNQILDAIRLNLLSAWPTVPKVFYGEPRTPADLPYAVINLGAITQSFEGFGASLSNIGQINEFVIVGRFATPTDPGDLIVTEQVARAQSLIDTLQQDSGLVYPEHTVPNSNPELPPIVIDRQVIGELPLVTSIDFSTDGPSTDGKYEVTLTFSLVTESPHH